MGLIPGLGRSRGGGCGSPLQYSCLENPMDRGAWWAAVHGVAKSQARLNDFTFNFHFHALEKEMATHSCSCLENPRDGGAWWAAVYGVAQNQTWLKRLSSSSSLEKFFRVRVKLWCWERPKAEGEGDDSGQDGWMASSTQCIWVWASSGRWGRTGKPGVPQSMGSERVRHDWVADQQQQKSEALIIGLVIIRQRKCDFCGKSLRNLDSEPCFESYCVILVK